MTTWHIGGDYFESCNCDPICPCRMVGGRPGGRSTHGICFGVLSWLIAEGDADGVDLAGLAAALTLRYDDDEPGSPWRFVVYVDERGSERQRELGCERRGNRGSRPVAPGGGCEPPLLERMHPPEQREGGPKAPFTRTATPPD